MTQTFPAAEVRAAGGLQKWATRTAQSPVQAHSPKRKEAKLANLSNLASLPTAKGRRPKNRLVGYEAGRMNKTETMYAELLETQRRAGKIVFWRFEAIKFRLADRTWYNPDFYIMRPDGSIEIHETKGHWEDDARVKIKATAEQFPEFWFVAVQWKKGEWKTERFRAGGNI